MNRRELVKAVSAQTGLDGRQVDATLKGFQDIQPYLYWSCGGKSVVGACGIAPAKGFEWSFSFGNGFLGTDLIENSLYAMVYYPTPGPIG